MRHSVNVTGQTTRSVFEVAVDNALIRHVQKLFDTYASDIEMELRSNPEEIMNSAVPGARKRFEQKLDIALLAHSNMMEVLKAKNHA